MKSLTLFLAGILVIFAAIFSRPVSAQTDTLPYKAYELGLFATGGLSVFNGTVPDGVKTDIEPAYTFGALGTFAANRDIGFALGLGYETRGMFFKQESKTVPNQSFTFSYISIQPSVRFKSFLLGVNIGLPSGFKSTYKANVLGTDQTYNSTNTTDSMNTLIDIRAEGLLPIVENDFGNLYFIVQASYCLSDVIGKGGFRLTQVGQTSTTPPVTKSPMPTVQIGLSYLISPGAKTK